MSMKILHQPFLWAISLLIIPCAWFAMFVAQEREPAYQGRSLTFWLKDARRFSHDGEQERAAAAIRKIGTAAIPCLLKMATAKDSATRKWLVSTVGLLGLDSALVTDFEQHRMAATGFYILGETADSAVPELIRLLRDTNEEEEQMIAMLCLGNIGPRASNAVPRLVSFTTNADGTLRIHAMLALGSIHSQPAIVVPALMAAISSNPKDGKSERIALWSLAAFGTDAKAAVPMIVQYLTNADFDNRACASNVLVRIDPETAEKMGVRPEVEIGRG